MAVSLQHIEAIEKQMRELSLELKRLKTTLDTKKTKKSRNTNATHIKIPSKSEHKTDITNNAEITNEESKNEIEIALETALPHKQSTFIAHPSHPSQWKVMCIEYCQCNNLSKPTESITETQNWNICWDYLSAKGCHRSECKWTHIERNKDLQTLNAKQMKNARFNAKVTLDNITEFGQGSSKTNAIYSAYQKLVKSLNIPLKSYANQTRNQNQSRNRNITYGKNPKSRLCEYAQQFKMDLPISTFKQLDGGTTMGVIWRATVVFNGQSVSVNDTNKKQAERKCCQKMLESLESIHV